MEESAPAPRSMNVKRPPRWIFGLQLLLTSAALVMVLYFKCDDRYPFVTNVECSPCYCDENGQLTCEMAANYGRFPAILDLKDRGIRSIKDDAFRKMRPIALDLSGNHIEEISPKGVRGLAGKLKMLYLWGNDVECSDVATLLPDVTCM